MDAASFTSLRMISGAITLMLILAIKSGISKPEAASWKSAAMLFTYMVFFSFAYLSLAAGTGALLLFGAVQITMFSFAIRRGERFTLIGWLGLLAAVGGLVYLVSPGVAAPNLMGAVMMIVAGIAWGIYSLLGKGATDPLKASAWNFTYSIPLVIIVSLVFIDQVAISQTGIILAIASGALASGCGYVIWYAVLPALKASQAATVQLTVPAIAAIGGVLILSEPLSARLVIASVATLGGVAIVLLQQQKQAKSG